MDKNWVGISVIGCAAASLLMLGGAWKKQHEMAQLELKERDAKHWIENDYDRRDRINELDKQSKVLAWGSAVCCYVLYRCYKCRSQGKNAKSEKKNGTKAKIKSPQSWGFFVGKYLLTFFVPITYNEVKLYRGKGKGL